VCDSDRTAVRRVRNRGTREGGSQDPPLPIYSQPAGPFISALHARPPCGPLERGENPDIDGRGRPSGIDGRGLTCAIRTGRRFAAVPVPRHLRHDIDGRGRPSGRPEGGSHEPSRFALRRSAVALAEAEDPPLPIGPDDRRDVRFSFEYESDRFLQSWRRSLLCLVPGVY
jgi:hypothetical protein